MQADLIPAEENVMLQAHSNHSKSALELVDAMRDAAAVVSDLSVLAERTKSTFLRETEAGRDSDLSGADEETAQRRLDASKRWGKVRGVVHMIGLRRQPSLGYTVLPPGEDDQSSTTVLS